MPKAPVKPRSAVGSQKSGVNPPLRPSAPDNLTLPPTGVPVGLNSLAGIVAGQSDAQLVRKSNAWRDNYNPLVRLKMRDLVAWFEMAERGSFVEVQLLLRKAEKRYPVLKGFIERLVSSLEELDWDVKPLKTLPPGATPAMAAAQQKFLRERYDAIANLREAIGQIALADIRGYTILQKHRYEDGPLDGAIRELYWLEPWCWSRDGYYGDFYYNELSRFGVGLSVCAGFLGEKNRIGSADLPREDFVIREVESPLYEIALIAFMNWLLGRKDWAAFVEIFGLAKGVVIMPPNIAIGKEQDYQTAAEKVSDGVPGALPAGSDIKFPTAGVRGEAPFKGFCEAQDEDLVMAATSGLLSMLTKGGGGLNQGPHKEHGDVWEKIAKMKGNRVNETFRKDIDRLELAAEFPGQPVCVQFTLAVQDDEDVNTVADTVVKFEGVGLQTDAKEISDRSGFKLTRVALPGGAGAAGDPAAAADGHIDKSDLNQAVKNRAQPGAPEDAFLKAIAEDLRPLRNRLAAIQDISDPELRREKLSDLHADMDRLKKDILADPSAARVLEGILAQGVVDGMNAKVLNRRARGTLILNGGSGSGNFGHAGRPGEVGGSGAEGIRQVVAAAKIPGDHSWTNYGVVTDAQADRYLAAGSRDTHGYQRVITADDARHALARHGADHLPLTPEDFEKIPEHINNATHVLHSPIPGKPDTIVHITPADGHVVVVEEVRTGRQKLAVKTMYKHPSTDPEKVIRALRAITNRASVAHTAATGTDQPSLINLLQSLENVK